VFFRGSLFAAEFAAEFAVVKPVTGMPGAGRSEAALACGVAGRQWSRRWKKRGDGSA
jgi:hypothetical protein